MKMNGYACTNPFQSNSLLLAHHHDCANCGAGYKRGLILPSYHGKIAKIFFYPIPFPYYLLRYRTPPPYTLYLLKSSNPFPIWFIMMWMYRSRCAMPLNMVHFPWHAASWILMPMEIFNRFRPWIHPGRLILNRLLYGFSKSTSWIAIHIILCPKRLSLRYQSWKQEYPYIEGNAPAFWLKSTINKFDPDILLTDFGDTWLLEDLLERVNNDSQQLPLSRDPGRSIRTVREKTYFSYGQIVYRGQQIHLFGRIHIDRKNAMMWGDYELEGVLENARVTALPIQTAARVSPGSGISCMQMITALRTGVLVPWHKQQVEQPRPMLDMIHADFGGLVYQPTIGLHKNVGAIDFVSMYPAVMVRCNISPEKQAISLSDPLPEDPGLVPQTLAPLLRKRVLLKQRIPSLPAWDPHRKWYKARAAAQKWLLVVCFGYLGYKNAPIWFDWVA